MANNTIAYNKKEMRKCAALVAERFGCLAMLTILSMAFAVALQADLVAGELHMVIEFTRHGDRTPIWTFPTLNQTVHEWWQGWGQLTPTGVKQHYELGKLMRKTYGPAGVGLLSSEYKRNEVWVRSTDIDRTLMSAEAQMAGLFPPGTAKETSSSSFPTPQYGLPYGWQAVPVHTVPVEDDLLLIPWKGCRSFTKAMEERKTTPEWMSVEAESSGMLQELAEVRGGRKEGEREGTTVTPHTAPRGREGGVFLL